MQRSTRSRSTWLLGVVQRAASVARATRRAREPRGARAHAHEGQRDPAGPWVAEAEVGLSSELALR